MRDLPRPAPTQPAVHLDYIDALRGAACLWVVAFHANMMWPNQFLTGDLFLSHLWTGFVSAGTLGVNVFLVLSGFCLFWPMARKNDLALSLSEFFRRRAWRILPPYYVVLLLSFLLTQWPETARFMERPNRLSDLPLHLLMLHNLRSDTFFSIFPPAWSLALEFQLYLVFPLLVYLVRRGGIPLMLGFAGGVTGIWIAFCAWRYGTTLPSGWSYPQWTVVYYSLPARLFEFALGVAGASLVARTKRIPARWVGVVGIAALSAFFGLGRWGPSALPSQNPIFGVAVAALLVLLGYRAVGEIGVAGRPLPVFFRPFIATGVFSYSLYLTHYQLIQLARGYLAPHLSVISQKFLFLLLIFPSLLLVGYLCFLLTERPLIERQKRRKRERTVPTQVASLP